MTVLAEALLAQVYAHARAAFPDECCGYLTDDAVIRCRNAQRDGHHPSEPARGADTGFVIAGAELLAFARSFDGPSPARVVYHSHTNGRAYFSDVDRSIANAGDRPAYEVRHLVVGVTVAGVTECALFGWSDAARDHVELDRWSTG
ncbi:MAG: Mov34/MPN/PAD-1 family protein [Kofleriaceae bacterium]